MSDPDSWTTLARARQLLTASHAGQAEALAREVIRADPTSAAGFEVLARALNEQERGEEAVEVARAGLQLAPEDLGLGLTLANGLIQTSHGSREARRVAHGLVESWPHAHVAHYTLARAYLAAPAAQPARALEAAHAALRLAPHDAATLNLCGVIHTRLRQPEQARQAFETALRENPTHGLALANLASADVTGLRLVRGGTRLSQAMLTDPNSSTLQRQFRHALSVIAFWFAAAAVGSAVGAALLLFAPRWLRLSAAVVTTLVIVFLAVRVTRSLPRGFRNWAPLVWRQSSWVARGWVLLGVVGVAATIAIGLAPTIENTPSASDGSSSPTATTPAHSDPHFAVPYLVLPLALWWIGRLMWRERKRKYGDDHTGPPTSARSVRKH